MSSARASSASIGGKIREVGFHSVIYGLGSVAQSAVQFLLIPVLTARLATADFGGYSLIQMAGVIAGSIFYLGMTSALPRSYFDYESEADRRSVFTTAFLLLLAGAAAQIAIGYAAGSWISRVLLRSEVYAVPVFWAFLGSALAFINQFFFTYLRFQRRSIASILLSVLALAGSLAISLHLLRAGNADITAPFQGIALAQAAVALVFIGFYGRSAFTWSLEGKEVAILLRFGVPTVLTSIAVMIIDWADRILIERMMSVEDVAVYSVGFRLGSIVNVLVITPFTQIWNPMMIEYRAHENIGEFFSKIVSYYFLASSVIFIATCLFVKDLLPFVARSPDYYGAAPVILLVMAGYLANGATNIVAAGLIYERRIFVFAAIYYAVALAKTVTNLLVIPRFGIIGAAVVTLLMYAAIPVAVYVRARRHFSIHFERWRLVRISAVVAASVLTALLVQSHAGLVFKLVLLVGALASLTIFCTDPTEKKMLMRSLT